MSMKTCKLFEHDKHKLLCSKYRYMYQVFHHEILVTDII